MKFFSITAQFVGGPFTFVLHTPDDTNLDKKTTAVVYERYRTKSFVPGHISFEKTIIDEATFNTSRADIKWDSTELELKN